MANENTFKKEIVDGFMNKVNEIRTGIAYTVDVSCEHVKDRSMPFFLPGMEYIEVVASSMVDFDTVTAEAVIMDDRCYPIYWYEDDKLISNDTKVSISSTHMNNFPVPLSNAFWLGFRQLMDYTPQRKKIKCIRGTKEGRKERVFEIRSYPNVKKELVFSTNDDKFQEQLPGLFRFKDRLEKFLQIVGGTDKINVGFNISFSLSGQWTEYINHEVYYKVEGAISPDVTASIKLPYGISIPRGFPLNVEACFFILFAIKIAGKISMSRRAPSSQGKSLEYVGGIESGVGIELGFEAKVEIWSMNIEGKGSASTSVSAPIELIGNADEISIQSKIGCSGLVLSVSFIVEGFFWDSSYTESWQVFNATSTEPLKFILGD